MAYDATVFRVMIASPSDVAEERDVVRKVLEDWNTDHSEKQGIVLRPISWETDSAPSMRGRPQAIINEQVLDGCDLLVAIFWTRIGSPTGEADSGSVEELDRHVAAGRPAMIYFSDAPMPPSRIDARQRVALERFKAGIRSRSLFESFASLQEFREKFRRHLQKIVDTDPHFDAGEVQSLQEQASVKLGDDARRLLAAAVASRGVVTVRQGLGHFSVQAGGENFGSTDPRERAVWISVVEGLRDSGLLDDPSGSGNLFMVTKRGYEVADAGAKPEAETLDEMAVRILQSLAQRTGGKPPAPEQLARDVGLDIAPCQLRLGMMEKRGLIYRHLNIRTGSSYSIQQPGLEVLQRLGKIS